MVQTFLLLDAIIVFKFILIFVLKKPILIMGDFWIVFLNIFILGFRLVIK